MSQPPFGPPQPPYSGPPPQPGQPPFPPYGGVPQRETAPGAIVALVLGIVGVLFCQVAAPFAWVLGRRAEETIAAEPQRYSGKDLATTAKILGIVGSVLLILGVIAGIVLIIVAVATNSS
jgi:uncharacterized membrane protein YjgN (DUF898 family)